MPRSSAGADEAGWRREGGGDRCGEEERRKGKGREERGRRSRRGERGAASLEEEGGACFKGFARTGGKGYPFPRPLLSV